MTSLVIRLWAMGCWSELHFCGLASFLILSITLLLIGKRLEGSSVIYCFGGVVQCLSGELSELGSFREHLQWG